MVAPTPTPQALAGQAASQIGNQFGYDTGTSSAQLRYDNTIGAAGLNLTEAERQAALETQGLGFDWEAAQAHYGILTQQNQLEWEDAQRKYSLQLQAAGYDYASAERQAGLMADDAARSSATGMALAQLDAATGGQLAQIQADRTNREAQATLDQQLGRLGADFNQNYELVTPLLQNGMGYSGALQRTIRDAQGNYGREVGYANQDRGLAGQRAQDFINAAGIQGSAGIQGAGIRGAADIAQAQAHAAALMANAGDARTLAQTGAGYGLQTAQGNYGLGAASAQAGLDQAGNAYTYGTNRVGMNAANAVDRHGFAVNSAQAQMAAEMAEAYRQQQVQNQQASIQANASGYGSLTGGFG